MFFSNFLFLIIEGDLLRRLFVVEMKNQADFQADFSFLQSKNGQNHVPLGMSRIKIFYTIKTISHAMYSMMILKLLLDSLL